MLEGTSIERVLDPTSIGRVGSVRRCWKGIGRVGSVRRLEGLEGTSLLEGFEPDVDWKGCCCYIVAGSGLDASSIGRGLDPSSIGSDVDWKGIEKDVNWIRRRLDPSSIGRGLDPTSIGRVGRTSIG